MITESYRSFWTVSRIDIYGRCRSSGTAFLYVVVISRNPQFPECNFQVALKLATGGSEACKYSGMFYGCKSLTKAPELPATEIDSYCYYGMFWGCSSLTEAPKLSVTNMCTYCYSYMFRDCTSMKSAPELPAESLADGCYEGMFWGCSSLAEAPKLSATNMCTDCYRYMFYGCSRIVSAPELPAKSLAKACYRGMFYGCTSLINAPKLPAETLTEDCYDYMFKNCAQLTTAPELPAKVACIDCYFGMFSGCTSLVNPPELPAEKLAIECYTYMFENCTSLTRAPELPAKNLAIYCYESMFSGCSNLVVYDSEGPGLDEWVTTGVGYTCEGMLDGTLNADHGTRTSTLMNHTYYLEAKPTPPAPDGLVVVNVSSEGRSDGMILRVDDTMEYATDSSTWVPVIGTEITGLSEGEVQVRYKKTSTAKAGESAKLTIGAPPKYKITWLAVEGEFEWGSKIATTSAEYGSIPIAPATPSTITGRVFSSWSPAISVVEGEQYYIAIYRKDADYAQITWDAGDGKFSDGKTQKVTYVDKDTLPVAPEIPTKESTVSESYSFDYWSPTISSASEDVKYIAHYKSTKNKYTITWKAGIGSFYDGNKTKVQEVEYGTMPVSPATPSGKETLHYSFVFREWTPSIATVSENASYIALYTAIKKTAEVTFNVNGHGIAPATQSVLYGETVEKPDDPTETGYTFGGWYKDSECKYAWDFDNDTVTGDRILYAKWTKNSYTVTFNANGHGTAPATQIVLYDEKVIRPADPTETGYTFGGWYKESGCTHAWDFDNDKVTAATILYAKWNKNSPGGSGGSGGGGGFVSGSSSGPGITGAKAATTPITLAADGTQRMDTAIASKPLSMFTAAEQKTIYGKGGQTAWIVTNGHYQLKDDAGNLIKNQWALVSDNLSSSGIGNVSKFYFDENGYMVIGSQWIKDADGIYRQYFFNDENGSLFGSCLMGGTKDDKILNENGQITGYVTKPAT